MSAEKISCSFFVRFHFQHTPFIDWQKNVGLHFDFCAMSFIGTLSPLLSTVIFGLLVTIYLLYYFISRSQISFFHADGSNLQLLKRKRTGEFQKYVTLVSICRAATPGRCFLNPFLFNGHLQTFWTVINCDDVLIHYKRRVFESEFSAHSGQFSVDFVVKPYEDIEDDETSILKEKYCLPPSLPPRTSFFKNAELSALPSHDNKPMLVALHGLSGGSHELYLRHAIAPLVKDGLWEACILNSRGCSQTKINTAFLNHARATWDIRQTIRLLRKLYPNRPLFGIGFSLGANILANVFPILVMAHQATCRLIYSSI